MMMHFINIVLIAITNDSQNMLKQHETQQMVPSRGGGGGFHKSNKFD